MEYLNLIISFVVGGGLSTLVNLKLSSRTQKVDFADKAVKFMEVQNDSLMARVEKLETDVETLLNFKCERPNCPTRVPPKIS